MIAPRSAQKTRTGVEIRVSMIPVPTVRATNKGTPKAATKLKNAASPTAWIGFKTRVETTVAMEFAASFIPLRKSKSNAKKIRKRTNGERERNAESSDIYFLLYIRYISQGYLQSHQ